MSIPAMPCLMAHSGRAPQSQPTRHALPTSERTGPYCSRKRRTCSQRCQLLPTYMAPYGLSAHDASRQAAAASAAVAYDLATDPGS